MRPTPSTPAASPLVSIVTPAYRAAEFIGATVASVQAQSFADWEMLIVDDASPDDTAARVEDLARRDPRLRLFRQPRNAGPAQARNRALAEARGRYVCFLDADDLWLPQKLERQLRFMRETGAAIGYTAYRRIDRAGGKVGRLLHVPARLTYRDLLKNTAIANLTSMVDTQQTGPLCLTDAGYDDYILWLSLLRRGSVARGLNEDLARYRAVAGSVSSRPGRSIAWVWHIYRRIEGIPAVPALWYLGHYVVRAVWKRLRY